jgi:endonuclease/exonuclease/phosphatase family metal-dependent hydrolase
VRLLTYNVRSLRDDADAVARVIRACRPDVAAIQEAPRFWLWRARCARLARRSGLIIVTGGRAGASNLLLVSPAVTVESASNVLFTADSGLHRRGAALAVLNLGGRRFALAGTHLDLVEPPRVRHVGELHAALDAVAPDGVPTVVAGDMNDVPESATWRLLAQRRVDVVPAGDGFTYSARNPQRRIDGVFADPVLRIRSAEVIDTPDVMIASDHRPVLVELDLSPRSGE